MVTEPEERIKKYRLLLEEADTGPNSGHMLVNSAIWAEALVWALDRVEYLESEYNVLEEDYNKMKEERMKGVWAGTKQSPVESES